MSKIFVEGWYQNGANKVDLLIKPDSDKVILKQKLNGSVVHSAKAAVTIVPGTTYNFRLTLDGAHFILSVDGVEKIRMPASGNPFGNVVLKLKNTSASFYSFVVY